MDEEEAPRRSHCVRAPPGPQIAAHATRQPRCHAEVPARPPCRATELVSRSAARPGSTVAKPCSPPTPYTVSYDDDGSGGPLRSCFLILSYTGFSPLKMLLQQVRPIAFVSIGT